MKPLNMYLLTFFMFSLTAIAQGSNQLSEPDFKVANFATAIEDRKLNGGVLRDFEVASEISCQFECISEERCLFYNFLPIHGKEIGICQLSDSDRFISGVNFTKEDGAIYRGIQSTCEQAIPCTESEICVVDYRSNSHFCKCSRDCPRNCLDRYQNGSTSDGVYLIYPDEEEPFQVLCDMTTNGGGCTTFQRRMDGSVDFYVDWESYKKALEIWKASFGLGITTFTVSLHLPTWYFELIWRITKADESDDYRLTIDAYRGTAGDALLSLSRPIRNMKFTTKDRDNDVDNSKNCALHYKGAWWFNYCHNANPNDLYQGGGNAQGITWEPFRGQDYSLKHIEIKLRPA